MQVCRDPPFSRSKTKRFFTSPTVLPRCSSFAGTSRGTFEIFDWTLSQAERERLEPPWRPRICAWLFTDGATGLPAVRRTMSTALRCSLQPGRTSYLRYFDPRVFPRLVQRLGHVAIEQVIREWHQFDRDGSMLRIVSDVQAEDTMAFVISAAALVRP